MSKKNRVQYSCQTCGHRSLQWLGRCPGCSSWNTFVEERVLEGPRASGIPGEEVEVLPVNQLKGADVCRVQTGVAEFDRVLGGGMVPGGAVLIGGEPGIGKSTLILEAMGSFTREGGTALYVTGEESLRQIGMRAERLGVSSDRLIVAAETSLERIFDAIKKTDPGAIIIDSVQILFTVECEASPGSLTQLRETSARLITRAKGLDATLFLIGHVTKEGFIAGPKALEHMVDTVLYFEGDKDHLYRILRAVKNRFGSVMETGIFEMTDAGLKEVRNPSEAFLAERPLGAAGSAVVPSVEGTRTVLVEVQSLLCPTAFGVPRRTIVGVDYNRVMILAAVLEKKAEMILNNHDIFVKVAGGIRLNEPAADLAIIASISSNFLDKALDPKTVVFGEVGLTGEVRAVGRPGERVAEAFKLGFTRCILPKGNLKGLKAPQGMDVEGVGTIAEAMEKFF
jgi:DNA repair protein RadA/Sms